MVDLSWKTITFEQQIEFQSFKIIQDFKKVYMRHFFNCLVYCHRISKYTWYSDKRVRRDYRKGIPGHYLFLLFLVFLLSFNQNRHKFVCWYTNASLKTDSCFDGSVLRSDPSTCRQQLAQRAMIAHLSPTCPEGQIWSFQQSRQVTSK